MPIVHRLAYAALAVAVACVGALPFLRSRDSNDTAVAPALGIGVGRLVGGNKVENFTPLQAPLESYESPAVGLEQRSETAALADPEKANTDAALAAPLPPSQQRSAAPPAMGNAYESLLSPSDSAEASLLDARDYRPAVGEREGSRDRWSGLGEEAPAEEAPTTLEHRIVDGDTLEGLAFEYLGNPALAGEILAANRDKIDDPQVLRLGIRIVIPLRSDTAN
ncbi:LysM peptidoglycan-binding domain-containing protein [Lignipirellula cremea]|uniref:LysM domain-containing protein n=1 Tax=Lignipirellula cremea TaxID=2528010 RepID=A0A518E1U0_9BACT|nr:LysM peptidoglycan-binding domain-containing protein [Lignipirellula cremea]QDU98041.1 hypothetical protein Pla8534_59020 [Lignipirellula cremea]